MHFGPRTTRIAIFVAAFMGPFGGGMVTVLIPEFRDDFGVSTEIAALAWTIYLIPFASLQLISGTIGERFGRDRALRLAFVVYAVGSIAVVPMTTIGPFLAARFVQGCANAFTTPLIIAKLAEETPEESMGRAMGTLASVQTAGQVMAPLIGGLAGAIDYRLAFVLAAVVSVVLVVVLPAGSGRPEHERPPRLRDALTPRTAWLSASSGLFFFCLVGPSVIVTLKAADEFGVSVDARGLLLALFGFAGVLAGRPAGKQLDRLGRRKVMGTGTIAAIAMICGLALSASAWQLALFWFATGACAALLQTTLSTMIITASTANRGGAISLTAAFRFSGAALSPVLWVPLYHADPHLSFVLAAALTPLIFVTAMQGMRARNTISRPQVSPDPA